jgi:predicted nucleic acid-binding Zn ribbon protein
MAGDSHAEPQVGTTQPLTALRERLAASRAAGESFEECWPATVRAVTAGLERNARAEWRACLEHTRSTWERCFDRLPPTAAELALERARVLIDRQPAPDRSCSVCGDPIPADKKAAAVYCSRPCQSRVDLGERREPDVAVTLEQDWSSPEQLELVA